MKIISKNIIQQWYQTEYNRSGVDSVYQSAPLQLQRFYDLLQKNKETVHTVLDLGCGDGRSMIELAKQGFEVTGVDLAGKEAVERRANAWRVRSRSIEGDIAAFFFEHEQYDAIISSEVFHLMSRPTVENVLDRMIQAANKKGFVYISILSNLKRSFLKTGEEFGFENQSDYTIYESTALLRRKFAGWDIIELLTFHDAQDWPLKQGNYPIEPYHWSGDYVYMIAQKG